MVAQEHNTGQGDGRAREVRTRPKVANQQGRLRRCCCGQEGICDTRGATENRRERRKSAGLVMSGRLRFGLHRHLQLPEQKAEDVGVFLDEFIDRTATGMAGLGVIKK